MLEQLKEDVWRANLELPRRGLVTYTWGNVSAIDRQSGFVVIKPSGLDYDAMGPGDMVVLELNGDVVEGDHRPSSDTPTHIELYRSFPALGGIAHTHSTWATAWAQAARDIPAYGTTHADYYYGLVPCTRLLSDDEIAHEYEYNTGRVIVEAFRSRDIDPMAVPAVIVSHHGPFTWGVDASHAVESSVVLEEIAKMALLTEMAKPDAPSAPQSIMDKHYFRKHGENAYYGQKKG